MDIYDWQGRFDYLKSIAKNDNDRDYIKMLEINFYRLLHQLDDLEKNIEFFKRVLEMEDKTKNEDFR